LLVNGNWEKKLKQWMGERVEDVKKSILELEKMEEYIEENTVH